jgi:hypothetical protein
VQTVVPPANINLQLADGTAAAPSLNFANDTNTGIFRPTTDSIGFAEGGTEVMRITSAGAVGVGTTTPSGRMTVVESDRTLDGIGNFNVFSGNPQAANLGGSLALGGLNGTGGAFDPWSFATLKAAKENSTSGNLAGYFVIATSNSGGSVVEKMRIDSSGNVLVGATSAATPTAVTSKFVSQGNFTGSNFGAAISSTAATGVDHYYISFQTGTNTQRGYIYYNNGAGQVQLSATSDARLKENIVDAPSILPILNQVKVHQYDWKETGNTNIGFIAQELYDVIPRAVAVGEDNEDGSIKRAWGVDNGTLVPYLVKAIQEQQAIIEELKATSISQQTKIDALEARLTTLENN